MLRTIATLTAGLVAGLTTLGGVAEYSTATTGYPAGQCTAYVASRLPWIPSDWGDADEWLSDATGAGFATIRGSDITAVLPGDVAVMAADTPTAHGRVSSSGHVGIVIALNRSAATVTLSSENWPEGDSSPTSLAFASSDIEGYILPPTSGTAPIAITHQP